MKKPSFDRVIVRALPTKAIEPPSNLEDYKIAIFGTKGIGKSTLANDFEDAFSMICEAPRRNLKINGYPNYAAGDPPLNYQSASEVADLYIKSKWKTLVVDTADRLYELCRYQFFSEYEGVTHESDVPYGKGWDGPKELFEEMLNRIAFSNKGLVIVSHATSKDRASYLDGGKIKEIRPTMNDRAWAWVQTACDIVLCYDYVGNDRVIVIRGNEAVMARCGCKNNFIDEEDGEPLNAILMPNDPDAGYDTLVAAFNNEMSDYYRQKEREVEKSKKATLAMVKNKVTKK